MDESVGQVMIVSICVAPFLPRFLVWPFRPAHADNVKE